MRWTIGMPSFNNFTEVFFTVQSLRMHHDLTDCEIIVVDNFGDDLLYKFIRDKGGKQIRYDRFNDIRGVSVAKNRIFEIARGDFVLCMDSHILLKSGTLLRTPEGNDFVQGPILFNNGHDYSTHWIPTWSKGMWGRWSPVVDILPRNPFPIWATGAGFFATRRDTWLGFNSDFRGFGGETGYIQEKYRQAGRRVLCDPKKVWLHMFCNGGRKIPFDAPMVDRCRNYIIGFEELGMDTTPIHEHFGPVVYSNAMLNLSKERILKKKVATPCKQK
jgi:glycosyltransferase involved in cell wall biosynthesis